MTEAQRLAICEIAKRVVRSAHVALRAGYVSPALERQIHRDIVFFSGVAALLEDCPSLNPALRDAVMEKTGEKLIAWMADGGCPWLLLGQDGPAGLH